MDAPDCRRPPTPAPILPPERWHALEPLLDAALELPPADRGAFLDDACAGDAALRAELAAMLDECERDDARLSRPAAERFASLLDERQELDHVRAALAPHYEVVCELGHGGTSTVYLARDPRHDREVAVKVLAPELADATNAARFLDEIRLTARLRHTHILPLFDSGMAGGRPWYVTPYVEGGTLRDRLEDGGAMPPAEVLRVLRELASALAYAHARGVVHRDVKPENVLLDVGGAVLGDFGIARAIERAAGADPSAAAGAFTAAGFGTPAYMAPEQRAPAVEVDHRADLYALGVIAYEMLCGRPPSGRHSRGDARAADEPEPSDPITARLHAEAPAAPHPPDEWSAILSRLLAERPEDRIDSAEELLRELDAIEPALAAPRAGSAGGRPRRQGRGRRAVLDALAAACVLAVAATSGLALWSWRTTAAASARRVLVVPFENATGDLALETLGRMAADWVAQGLAQTGAVDVSSAPLPSGGPRGRTLRDLAREFGAGTLVSGTYYLDRDSVRLVARIIDVSDWTLLHPVVPVAAARAAPQAVLEPLRQRVMANLALTHDPRIAGWVMGAPPPTYEAYEQFINGLDIFAAGNWEGALPLWAHAAALDSSFVQPLLQSVFGYMFLGRLAEADSLVRRISARETLAPFDRSMLDFQRGQISGDHAATLASARAMVRATPNADLPYYLNAMAALHANRPREALEAAAHVHVRGSRFDAPWSSTMYWRVVTAAHHSVGEHEAELKAARTARELQPELRDIVWLELRARAALGRLDALDRELGRLERLPASRDGGSPPDLLIRLANELEAHGHPARAREVLRRALQWQRAHRRDAERHADALYDLARTLHRLGDDAAAEPLFARLAAGHPADPRYPAYQAIIAARRGRIADARRIAERLRALRAPYDHGLTSYMRARIASQSGDRSLALALLRQALAEGFESRTTLHADPELAPLRDEPGFRELLRPEG
ncbi:MAG TPA: serine/threonine-protein kinase [Longimicrobiales bacterium]